MTIENHGLQMKDAGENIEKEKHGQNDGDGERQTRCENERVKKSTKI